MWRIVMESVSNDMAVTGLMDEPDKQYRKDIPERILRGNVRFFRKFLKSGVTPGAMKRSEELIDGWQSELRRRGLAEE
jgi:hypothetical protein